MTQAPIWDTLHAFTAALFPTCACRFLGKCTTAICLGIYAYKDAHQDFSRVLLFFTSIKCSAVCLRWTTCTTHNIIYKYITKTGCIVYYYMYARLEIAIVWNTNARDQHFTVSWKYMLTADNVNSVKTYRYDHSSINVKQWV